MNKVLIWLLLYQSTLYGFPNSLVMNAKISPSRVSATDRPLVLVVVLSLLGLGGIMGSLFFVTQDHLEKTTIEIATRYSEVIREFRDLYTEKVVAKAVTYGMKATHDFENSNDAIPLPATLTKILGERLGELGTGAETHLYSAYPFPWRKRGGPRDDFEKAALQRLQENPEQPFVRIETRGKTKILRFATAETMKTACVRCHNSMPDSPKSNWQLGDVRGVLEIILPIRTSAVAGLSGLNRAFLLSGFVLLLGVVTLSQIFWRYRKRVARDARYLGRELERTLEHRNQILESALDAIISVDESGRIFDFNPSAERIFGYSFEEAIGKDVAELIIPDAARESHRNGFYSYLETGEKTVIGQRRELLAKGKEGEEFPIELTLMENSTDDRRIFSAFIRDITEQKLAQKAQLQSEERMRDFANSAADRFWETDAESFVTYASPPTHSLARPEFEILGKTHWDAQNWYCEDGSDKELENAFMSRQPFHGKRVSWRWPGGEETHVLMNGIPQFDEEGKFSGYRGSTISISAEVAARREAERAKIQAETANRAKSEFLANISHELRTPLNAVIGFTEVLQGKSYIELKEENSRNYLKIIKESGEHLLNLINDILDVSRIEDGKLELMPEELVFDDVLDICLKLISSRAEGKALRFNKKLASNLPKIFADQRMLKQIIINFLSNAVKFSDEGGTIAVEAGLDQEGAFFFVVSDEGIGMDEAGIEAAMTKFGQVDSGFERNQDGTGLGLPLSLGLVKAHSGEMRIDSELGQGTTVTVVFPKERVLN